MWADDCFRTTFGLACRQRLDVSKIHIHVGHDVLQRNFVEDWLDYLRVSFRVFGCPVAWPCLWGKLQNVSFAKVSNFEYTRLLVQ